MSCNIAPPGPPTPKVTDWTKSTVDLEWIPPLIDGGSKITGYFVEFKEEKKEGEKEKEIKAMLDDGEEKEVEVEEWEKVNTPFETIYL